MKILRKKPVWLLSAWLVALGLNIAWSVLRPGTNPDTARYDRIAWNLLQGHGYSSSPAPPYRPEIFRAPGYPAFLALVYWLFGHDFQAVRLVQAFLISLLVPVGYILARKVFDVPTASVSAWLIALYPFYWVYSALIMSDGLATVLTAFMIWLLAVSLERKAAAWAFATGVTLGVLCLVRPAFLLFPVAVGLIYGLQLGKTRQALALGLACLLGMVFPVLPWTVRNANVTGRLILVASGNGLVLYLGALQAAYGHHPNVLGSLTLDDPRALSEWYHDDAAITLARDAEFAAEAKQLIRRHFGRYLGHLMINLPWLYVSAWDFESSRWVLSKSRVLFNFAVLALGAAGLLTHRAEWRRTAPYWVLLVYLALVHAPFPCQSRYTMPGRISLLIFTAAFLTWLAERLPWVTRHPAGKAATSLSSTNKKRGRGVMIGPSEATVLGEARGAGSPLVRGVRGTSV